MCCGGSIESMKPLARDAHRLLRDAHRLLREPPAAGAAQSSPAALNLMVISDGASAIRGRVLSLFGSPVPLILDWYHLQKKTGELMSMIARNKQEKEQHLACLEPLLWAGQSQAAIAYLQTAVAVRNRAKQEELIHYLEKHQAEIIDYGRRQQAGKTIGSGRMEKGVDQVIGIRQKHKAMSWSAKGSKALAILKVAELNGQWEQLWFPDREAQKLAA